MGAHMRTQGLHPVGRLGLRQRPNDELVLRRTSSRPRRCSAVSSATGISMNSLGACIEYNHTITMYCEEGGTEPCRFYKVLDLQKLAETLGPDHSTLHDDLTPHLWCLKCGSRKVTLRLSPDSAQVRKTAWPSSAWTTPNCSCAWQSGIRYHGR